MKIAFLTDNYMENKASLDPWRSSLLADFAKVADQLLYVQVSDFLGHDGQFINSWNEDVFLSNLRDFKPDIVFSLNRAGLNLKTLNAVGGSKVISWYIDNPNRFSNHLLNLASGEDVYCATKYMCSWWGQRDFKQSIYLPFCTSVEAFRKRPIQNDPLRAIDVSYVGTLWDPSVLPKFINKYVTSDHDLRFLFDQLLQYEAHYDFPVAQNLHMYFGLPMKLNSIKNMIDDFVSSQKRLRVLQALSCFSLEVYGTASTWPGYLYMMSPQLFSSFRFSTINTNEQLSELYHRSRCCISIAHHQAQSGFPIRVFDIMASGTPLLSDRHSELSELFEENEMYLGFGSAEEAKDKLKYVIENKAASEKIAERAFHEVASKHTFSSRVSQILNRPVVDGKKVVFRSLSKTFDWSCFKASAGLSGDCSAIEMSEEIEQSLKKKRHSKKWRFWRHG